MSWSVGDDRRSYAPFWKASQSEAEAAAAELLDTLRHFVGLEISIEQVTDEAATAEADELGLGSTADDLPVVHLLLPDRTIACGVASADTAAWATREVFDLSNGNICGTCRRAANARPPNGLPPAGVP